MRLSCDCNGKVESVRGEGGSIVAYFCLQCRKRWDGEGRSFESLEIEAKAKGAEIRAANKPVKSNVEKCDHKGRLDTVKTLGGGVLAHVCGACHERLAVLTCEVCSKPFAREFSKRGLAICSDSCRKERAKQQARERKDDARKAG